MASSSPNASVTPFTGRELFIKHVHLSRGLSQTEAEREWESIVAWNRRCWTELAAHINAEVKRRITESLVNQNGNQSF